MEEVKIHQLANGFKLIIMNKPERHSVQMDMYVKTGVRWEGEKEIGITHLTEHMLFKGTSNYPSTIEYSKAIANIGGDINAETGAESTSYSLWVGRGQYLAGLDLFLRLFSEPLLRNEDLLLEKKVILAELRECFDVDIYIDDILWRDHPLGYSVVEEKRNIKQLTIEDVKKHFSTYYVPNNMVMVVVGPVDIEQVILKVEKVIGKMVQGNPPMYIPFTKKETAPVIKFQKWDKKVFDVDLAFYAYPYEHPNCEAAILLKDILGNGPTSRLFVKLREELGLVYSVEAKLTRWQDTGSFQMEYSCNKVNLAKAIKNVVMEIIKIKREVVGTEELERTKHWRIACLENEYDTVKSLIERYGMGYLYDDFTNIDTDIKRVKEVSVEEIQIVARDLLNYNNMCFLLTGPQIKLEEKKGLINLLEQLA